LTPQNAYQACLALGGAILAYYALLRTGNRRAWPVSPLNIALILVSAFVAFFACRFLPDGWPHLGLERAGVASLAEVAFGLLGFLVSDGNGQMSPQYFVRRFHPGP